MFENRTTDELVRIAMAGGGMEIFVGNRTTDEIVRIAMAASGKGARLILRGLQGRHTDEIVRIGMAGKGCVLFANPLPD